jgi:hypothetical protein
MTSFNVVSEIAIEPERECSTPTFIGASQWLPARTALPAIERALAEMVESRVVRIFKG